MTREEMAEALGRDYDRALYAAKQQHPDYEFDMTREQYITEVMGEKFPRETKP